MTEELPPHAPTIEKAVLSVLMKYPERLADTIIDEGAFFIPAHQTLYREAKAAGAGLDLVTFVDDLHKRNLLESVGGPAAVTEVYTYIPNDQHLEKHLAEIRDCHDRRKAVEFATSLMVAANDRGDRESYVNALSRAGEVMSAKEPAASRRLADLAGKTMVRMADYETMEPHQARSLLPRSIWRDILREGCLAILGGESKAKKSWFSLAFAMHAVAELPFLGIPIEAGDSPRRAVVLDYELMEGNIMSRFLALSEKFEGDADAMNAIWKQVEIRCHRSIVAEDVDWIGYCCAVIEQASRGDIVIVDCLQALPTGDVNDPREVRRVLGRLQAAATASGACVIVVDHFNKSGEAKGMNRLSGSMAKAATPDAILLLESDGKEFIKFTTELRMDLPRDPMTLEFRSASEGFRVVDSEEREERKEAAKDSRQSERLAAMFPEIGRSYTKKEVAANAGVSEDTAGNYLKALASEITTTDQGAGKPKLYSLQPTR